MSILMMPSAPFHSETRFGLSSNVQADLFSPLSHTSQFLMLVGARWRGTFVLPRVNHAQAGPWKSFGVQLRGRSGQFQGFDPDARAIGPRGTAKDKPFGTLTYSVDSPAQAGGNQVVMVGAGVSEAGVFLTGDYISWPYGTDFFEMHMVVQDANADASGAVTATIEPPIRIPPKNGNAVVHSPALVTMRLVEDDFLWDSSRISRYGFSFDAIEVFGQNAP